MKRLDLIGIGFAIFCLVFCVLGLTRIQTNTEDVLQWLPDSSSAREDYNFLQSQFGSDDFLIATWDGCQVADPRLSALTAQIRGNDPGNLIQAVTNGAEVTQLLARDFKLSPAKITRRLKGIFFGIEQSDLTCVVIELSQAGTAARAESMQLIYDSIGAVPNLHRQDVKLGGYPYVATVIDGQLKNSFRNFLLPSILLATFVAMVCLRNLTLTFVVFITAVGAAMVSIAFIPMCGVKYGGLMSIIPALVFVLATSGSIHLIRYSLGAIGDPRALLAIGWKPCAISALTTAVGMLSLTRSSFPAIRNFGFFCATGVCIALAFQLVMVPWLLSRLGVGGLRVLASRSNDSSFWLKLFGAIRDRRIPISCVFILVMALGGLGLKGLIAEVEVEKLFRPESKILRSIMDMEARLGPMDQTELLLVFEDVDAELFPERAVLVRQVQAAIDQLPEVGVAHSLANFLPPEPNKKDARSFFKWSTYRNVMRRERKNLSSSNLLFVSSDMETWRISVRFPFTEKSDFGKLAEEVMGASQRTVADATALNSDWSAPRLIYTGKTHLFHNAQMTLLQDLFLNFLLAFLIITPILILVLRSLTLGLVAMLPNLFPVLIVFGGLGLAGHPVDLAIAMTACVALGIAVDDTTHFLIRFRDFGGRWGNLETPIKLAIGQCGPAMFHTTLIGGAGLIVYYFAEMLVVSQFSWVITILLVLALLSDVVMLPAILLLFAGDHDGD
ncbi:MAG: MMPL family transporter [Mariniblastus sp.]|nr:MMPL family transporter [Mariniblastus sp.]